MAMSGVTNTSVNSVNDYLEKRRNQYQEPSIRELGYFIDGKHHTAKQNFLIDKYRKAYLLLLGIFRKAPQIYLVQVLLVIHEYRSEKHGYLDRVDAG